MSTAKYAVRLVTVLALAGVAFGAGETHKDLRFKVGKRPMVSINNPYGPVIVRTGAAHEVVVKAVLHSDKVEIDQSQSRSRIDIVSHLLQGADSATGVIEYEVWVPAEASVSLRSESGRIRAEKLRGDLSMESSTGAMEVADFGNGHLHVKALNGPVTISDVHNGSVEITSVAGDVSLTSVSGPTVSVNSNTGKIEYAGDFAGEGE